MTLDKWLSLLVAAMVLTIIFSVEYLNGGIEPVKELLPMALPHLLICLPLIWFGDFIGETIFNTGWHRWAQPSPGWMIKGFGWLFLVAPLIVYCYSLTLK
jgi:hypothetical protein